MKYQFYYAGIRVRNLTRSLRFYTKALGMKPDNRGTMGHGGKYVQLVSPGTRMRLELNWYPPGSTYASRYLKGEELDHLAFDVEGADVDEEIDRLVALGGTRARPTEVRPKFVVGFVMDPDGIWLELYKERK